MKTWKSLGYLGLIPFWACLLIFEFPPNNLLFDPQQAFLFYSMIILSFLAGTLWRKATLAQYSTTLIISNIFCLYAYFCFFLPVIYALIVLPIGYVSLFLVEYLMSKKKECAYTKPYLMMRFVLTLLVSLLHGFALILWF